MRTTFAFIEMNTHPSHTNVLALCRNTHNYINVKTVVLAHKRQILNPYWASGFYLANQNVPKCYVKLSSSPVLLQNLKVLENSKACMLYCDTFDVIVLAWILERNYKACS